MLDVAMLMRSMAQIRCHLASDQDGADAAWRRPHSSADSMGSLGNAWRLLVWNVQRNLTANFDGNGTAQPLPHAISGS